jgi:putative aminopeptidase FrvX
VDELLRQLTEARGVSGYEFEIRRLIRDLIADHVDEWRVDPMGNLLAKKKGAQDGGMRVMIDAHMDEVGLMVTGVDRDGTCKFVGVGMTERVLPGTVVQVGRKKLTGVIGLRPIHLLKRNEIGNLARMAALRIDIGAKSKEQASNKVRVGDIASFVTNYEEFEKTAIGKAFDNRAGCAVLIELLRRDRYPFDLLAAFTVQEEVGLRGAKVAAFALKPDAALILECTPAYDLPNDRDVSPNVSLGEGPSIYVMDSGTFQDPRLVAHITRTAGRSGIPFQIRRPGGGGTNSAVIQRAGAAIPVATIATPARYTHTPVSLINLDDYRNVIELADEALRSLTPDAFQRDQGSFATV